MEYEKIRYDELLQLHMMQKRGGLNNPRACVLKIEVKDLLLRSCSILFLKLLLLFIFYFVRI